MHRYWQNVMTSWVESEHLFDIVGGPYDDFFVFDEYAVVLKDQKIINVIFFDQFRGQVLASNYEMIGYNDLRFTQNTIIGMTFWDASGRGDYTCFAAVKSQGAVVIYPFSMTVSPRSYQSIFRRDDQNTAVLFASTAVTTRYSSCKARITVSSPAPTET
mgnify:CR=1 FL=1